jgi:tRNA A-37 threonylcarbamoyl transferase component Bud32
VIEQLPRQRRALVFHGRQIHCHPQWQARLQQAGVLDKRWQNWSEGELVAASHITRCYRVTLDNNDTIYLKRYNYARSKLQFSWPLPSKAAVEKFGYGIMQQLGIACPQVLAMGEQRRFGQLQAAFIITHGVKDSDNLENFARHTWYPMAAGQRQLVYRQIRNALLKQLRTAHSAGFCHHDLKWRNVLVRAEQDEYTTYWIDCPRARFMKRRTRRLQLVDLGALARLAISYLSPFEQMRFLHDYLGPQQAHLARQLFLDIQAYLARRPPDKLDLPARQTETLS